MYAVFQTGGKQYRAGKGDKIRVEKLDATEGEMVGIDRVLMVTDGDDVKVGAPYLTGGEVSAIVTRHGRGEKIRIVKHRRRKHYHKETGHRQHYTEIEITGISAG
jgi:large subunit ribosomal protein L21